MNDAKRLVEYLKQFSNGSTDVRVYNGKESGYRDAVLIEDRFETGIICMWTTLNHDTFRSMVYTMKSGCL